LNSILRLGLLADREDLSIEFTRLLGAAQEGSTVAECWVAASRIDLSDDNSWYREWWHIADASCERGNAALEQRHVDGKAELAARHQLLSVDCVFFRSR
jgi:hypothetical protein